LAYWREQLAGAPAVLELPTDHPRPPVQSFAGASKSFVLSGDMNRALSQLSQSEGATRFMVLLAAFKVLLHYYGKQEEIVVGINVANRNRREIEALIGFFVNTLALRSNLGGNPSFRELLQRVREVALGAYAHQDLPFEKLVGALESSRDANLSPLFRVKVEYDELTSMIELPELRIEPLEINSEIIRTDLRLSLAEGADALFGSLVYDRDLFDASTISRMVEHYETLLRLVGAESETKLSELVKALADDDMAHARKSLEGGKKASLQRLKERVRRPVPDPPTGEESRI
jgi:non-ribosomal peptide synthetase component F